MYYNIDFQFNVKSQYTDIMYYNIYFEFNIKLQNTYRVPQYILYI